MRNVKRRYGLYIGAMMLAALFCLLTAAGSARAEAARNIVDQCHLYAPQNTEKLGNAHDGNDFTMWSCSEASYLQFEVPEGQTVHGVYIKWGMDVPEWQIVKTEDSAEVLCGGSEGHAHEYKTCLLESGTYRLKLTAAPEDGRMRIREIALYTDGELPKDVQVWQVPSDKVDLMAMPAHPDDELLFFGGTLPYYAGELKKDVLVVYPTCATYNRRTEMLNGLWHCGVRLYPVIGPFDDEKFYTANEMYRHWGGREKVLQYFTEVIRRYRPDVIVTHDVNGEYGHGGHMAVCASVTDAVTRTAADAAYETQSAPWQVKKLYVHLYEEQTRDMNWEIPLEAFDGKTAFKIAEEAFLCHESQTQSFNMHSDGSYSCRRFGLAYSSVGDDVNMDDFFENINKE
ncbi:MAG: PIG-L family deacetylase [Clostridia bacterium]|nr:PIG-L family deacetylase [Clostridia bacterium]